MANRHSIVQTFPSTNWEWRLCRVRSGAAPAGDSPSAGRAVQPLRQRDQHKPLAITVRFRGGPEASWLVDYRGRTWRLPGHLSLHDALSALSLAHSFNGRPAIANEG
jgi:hypothetical protein